MHRQHRKMTAEHDSTAPCDTTAPQTTTQGGRAPQQTAPATGKPIKRQDRDTDTETCNQQTFTGHQTRHRTTEHQKKQHNRQQRTTALHNHFNDF